MKAQYACAFCPNPEGGYSVRCPAFPEVIAHGESIDNARAANMNSLDASHRGGCYAHEPSFAVTPAECGLLHYPLESSLQRNSQ